MTRDFILIKYVYLYIFFRNFTGNRLKINLKKNNALNIKHLQKREK